MSPSWRRCERPPVPDRLFDDGAEMPVLLLLEADIARIDAVLRQRLGACGMIGEEPVADIVEIPDEGDEDAEASRRSRILGTAAAASSRSTVMRTISDPARARDATWATVASTSAVSVLVID